VVYIVGDVLPNPNPPAPANPTPAQPTPTVAPAGK
jgi:hypothetical protein